MNNDATRGLTIIVGLIIFMSGSYMAMGLNGTAIGLMLSGLVLIFDGYHKH